MLTRSQVDSGKIKESKSKEDSGLFSQMLKDKNIETSRESKSSRLESGQSSKEPKQTERDDEDSTVKESRSEKIDSKAVPSQGNVKGKKSEKEKTILKFMDSFESEFKVPAEQVALAMVKLEPDKLTQPPEATADAVIEQLDLDSDQKQSAKQMYLGMIQDLNHIEQKQNQWPIMGQNSLSAQEFKTRQGQAVSLHEQRNQAITQMNNQFWMKDRYSKYQDQMASSAASQMHTDEPMTKSSEDSASLMMVNPDFNTAQMPMMSSPEQAEGSLTLRPHSSSPSGQEILEQTIKNKSQSAQFQISPEEFRKLSSQMRALKEQEAGSSINGQSIVGKSVTGQPDLNQSSAAQSLVRQSLQQMAGIKNSASVQGQDNSQELEQDEAQGQNHSQEQSFKMSKADFGGMAGLNAHVGAKGMSSETSGDQQSQGGKQNHFADQNQYSAESQKAQNTGSKKSDFGKKVKVDELNYRDIASQMQNRETLRSDQHLKTLGPVPAEMNQKNQNEISPQVKEVMNQAQYMIKNGGGEMKVKMTPEGLGDVHLKVLVQDGKVNVQMMAETKEAKNAIEHSLSDLKTSLNAHKLSVDNIKVDVVAQTQTDNQAQMNQNQNSDSQRNSARQFWNQFNDNFGNSARRESLFDLNQKEYPTRRSTEPLRPLESQASGPTRRVSGKGDGINLVA